MLVKEALNKIMKEHKIADQYEMAKVLGVSQPTISNYMKGSSYPQLPIAAYIYGVYGHRCEPFTEEALKKEWELVKARKGM